MNVLINALNPDDVAASDLADFHAMRVAVGKSDMPEDPEPTFEVAMARLRAEHFNGGVIRRWSAHVDGKLIGFAQVDLPEGANSGLARLEVVVHPGYRRRGLGIQLLRHVLPTVVEAGRGVVAGAMVKPDSAGAAWSARLGFAATDHRVIQALVVSDTDPAAWDRAAVPGYRLQEWAGVAPESLIASYAVARGALDDAPLGTSTYREDASWTPERVRRMERELAEEGTDEWVVVAVDEATGEVVGLTQVHRRSHRQDLGFQMTTAVVAGHRGHGLGLAMKGRMMNVLMESWPELERVHTNTSAENEHMIAINIALGYRTHREFLSVESPVERLVKFAEDWR
jgi:GNAT superfamily N-acetyltransferase